MVCLYFVGTWYYQLSYLAHKLTFKTMTQICTGFITIKGICVIKTHLGNYLIFILTRKEHKWPIRFHYSNACAFSKKEEDMKKLLMVKFECESG